MTEEEARARLKHMVAWDSVPALSLYELDELITIARRPDEDGLLPSDDGWTETYDLRAAAAEGWLWKAGKVAGAYSFGSDGQNFSRSDMHEHCLTMSRRFRRGGITSVEVATLSGVGSTDIIGNVNEG